ncbi:hypothetical protein ACBJ59_10520 [Nonomuraea sp. MTCD27]|uniref:hypothetical protein n=1 Tax=Nonomuraea sp. MTCD27 TaxID=1676747 RepID=UPI0035C1BA37
MSNPTSDLSENKSELTGEPAVYAAFVAAVVQAAAAFFLPLTDNHVVLINAAVLAAAGVWVAFKTRAVDGGGSIKAALLGFVQAVMSVAIAFGWDASDKQTAAVMLLVSMGVTAWIRQTSTPNPPVGRGVHAGQDLPSL